VHGTRPDPISLYIPASFGAPHREELDTQFMRALFQTGFEMAAKGYPWVKRPPGF
jgi:hypothetical protein